MQGPLTPEEREELHQLREEARRLRDERASFESSMDVLRKGNLTRLHEFVEPEKAAGRSVVQTCAILNVLRSAYYESFKHTPSKRARDDAVLVARIETIYRASLGEYGAPRIHVQLRQEGIACGKKRVARLMAVCGLAGKPRRVGIQEDGSR